MALRHQPGAGPADLAALTGLSRPTVRRARARARAWAPPARAASPRLRVPVALLAERGVGAYAKVLYALLKAVPGFHARRGRFAYSALSAQTGLGVTTLKRAVSQLARARWVQVTRPNRLQPVRFKLGTPELARSEAAVALARRRLARVRPGQSRGEALMHEYLSLLIASDHFTENARPGFLVNPATGKYTQADVDEQRLRDLVKAGTCKYEGIHLVIIHPADLSAPGLLRKIGACLPLRSLAGQESLIYLASVPATAQEKARQTTHR